MGGLFDELSAKFTIFVSRIAASFISTSSHTHTELAAYTVRTGSSSDISIISV